jgi:hypothetical protein
MVDKEVSGVAGSSREFQVQPGHIDFEGSRLRDQFRKRLLLVPRWNETLDAISATRIANGTRANFEPFHRIANYDFTLRRFSETRSATSSTRGAPDFNAL